MALKIKKIKRVQIAVKDINSAIKQYKKLFDIDPFEGAEVPELNYKWVAFRFNKEDPNQCVVEFLSPINDPDGTMPIGKFIKKRGEGLFQMSLETETDNDVTEAELRRMGIEPTNGRGHYIDGADYESWTESYIHPKDACGVQLGLGYIVPKLPRKDISGLIEV